VSTIVNTNVSAIGAKTAMAHSQRSLEKSMQQLSTGHRINSAADDAAGLTIGNKLGVQIVSLNQAVRNANEGIAMLQTADGASGQMVAMFQRMRELAIQAANDTNDQSGRDALNLEFAELQSEISNSIRNTSWNGMQLLDLGSGSSTNVHFHVGPSSSDNIALPLASLNSSDVETALDTTTTNISSLADATSSLTLIDNAITQIDNERGKWGAMMNRLTFAADNANNIALNSSASRSRIMDTDYAQATAEMAKAMILDSAGSAMLTQANQRPMYVLALLS
jgi:flagellin